jgi:hypothetical protein
MPIPILFHNRRNSVMAGLMDDWTLQIGRYKIVFHYEALWRDLRHGHWGVWWQTTNPEGIPEISIGPFQFFY